MDAKGYDPEGLLDLAKRAILEALGGPPLIISQGEKLMLSSKEGAFVTVKVKDELRGCIGRLDTEEPLWRKITKLSKAAALEDSRFDPVAAFEVDDVSIEITILGEPVPVTNIDEIEIGRDGLIVEKGENRGLLLPQVATENDWNQKEFIAHTCLKAGLPADAWSRGIVALSRFEGIIFK